MKLFFTVLLVTLSFTAFAGDRATAKNGPVLQGPFVLKPFPGYVHDIGGTIGDQTNGNNGGDTHDDTGNNGPGGGTGDTDPNPNQTNKRSHSSLKLVIRNLFSKLFQSWPLS